MRFVLLAMRLVLAGVFAVSGATKMADRRASRVALTEFGVPSRTAAPLSVILPVFEVVVAVALLPVTTARWAARAALALLVTFTGAIAVNLAHGRKPRCHCFGQLSAAPIGPSTLVRNAAFAALTSLFLRQRQSGPSVGEVVRFSQLSTKERLGVGAGAAGFGLLALQGLLILDLMRQLGRVLRALDLEDFDAPRKTGLPEGSMSPEIRLINVATGDATTLEGLRGAELPVAFVFVQPNCGHCTDLLPEVGRWQREHADAMTLAVIAKGTDEEIEAERRDHGLGLVLSGEGNPVFTEFSIFHTPAMVIIRTDGAIGHRTAVGPDDIRSLVSTVVTGGRDSTDGMERAYISPIRGLVESVLAASRH